MLTIFDISLRLGAAAAFGCVIGIERERLDWTAGMRTHMLVCLGAALVIIVSAYGFEGALRKDLVILDPSRIAAQVVSGIGFLGAGTILIRGRSIKGLTTAASLWSVAAVGLASGAGLYLAAAIATFLMLVILALLKPLEQRLFRSSKSSRLRLTISGTHADLPDVLSTVARLVEIRNLDIVQGFDTGTLLVTIVVRNQERTSMDRPLAQLSKHPLIRSMESLRQ